MTRRLILLSGFKVTEEVCLEKYILFLSVAFYCPETTMLKFL